MKTTFTYSSDKNTRAVDLTLINVHLVQLRIEINNALKLLMLLMHPSPAQTCMPSYIDVHDCMQLLMYGGMYGNIFE